ncbi:MAG: 50S ribosomal protein L1, partial [Rhodocyclaceae bacterium]|nr:50S ribosomal protein L1 [Rhodocyclaceae bacterium]
MAKHSKRVLAARAKVDRNKSYPLTEALTLVKENATAKFNESIDVAVNLGIDARKSDQVVRGSVVLPAGTGKSVRVAVFAQGAKAEEARAAGADIVGFDDLAANVKAGQIDFDVCIATPDAMKVVGQLGQILGPRGLMPNPKSGTIATQADLPRVIRDARKGRVEFKPVSYTHL